MAHWQPIPSPVFLHRRISPCRRHLPQHPCGERFSPSEFRRSLILQVFGVFPYQPKPESPPLNHPRRPSILWKMPYKHRKPWKSSWTTGNAPPLIAPMPTFLVNSWNRKTNSYSSKRQALSPSSTRAFRWRHVGKRIASHGTILE